MSASLSNRVRNGITIPTIWVALALSLLIHVAALWKMPQVKLPVSDPAARAPPLIVELARRPPRLQRLPAPPARPRPPQAQRPPAPPPVARSQPAPRPAPPKGPGIALPPSPPAPGGGDLAAYVEA